MMVMVGCLWIFLPHEAAAGGVFPFCQSTADGKLLHCEFKDIQHYDVHSVFSTVAEYNGAEKLRIALIPGPQLTNGTIHTITIEDTEGLPKTAKLLERCLIVADGCRSPAFWFSIDVYYATEVTSLDETGLPDNGNWNLEIPKDGVFSVECACQPDPASN